VATSTARLVEVAVDALGADAGVIQQVGELFGERAGAREDQLLARACGELDEYVLLVALLEQESHVADVGRGLVFTGDLVDGRVDEELLDERRHP
jgi:hypothetical protein